MKTGNRQTLFSAAIVALVAVWAVPCAAQLPDLKLGKPAGDLDLAGARYTGASVLQDYMRQTAERSFADENLMMFSQRFLGLERYEASRLDLALEGLGAGATMGLFAGAVANTAGIWNEDTSWYIAGAAAALGAFLGLTKSDDARVRQRWSVDVGPPR